MNSLINYFKGKKVLVTGGAGFIGSHLAEKLLELEADVLIYDIVRGDECKNLSKIFDKIKYYNANICCYDSFSKALEESKPNIILHLAANASVPKSSEDPLFDFEQNAKGTAVVLEAIKKICPESRVVLTSSGAVYGDPGTSAIRETDCPAPISPYGSSKYISEIQLCLYHRSFGISGSIARLFNCYGPRLPRFVVLDFLKKLEKDSATLETLGDGKQTRDFTFVSDTVSGILTVAANGQPAEAYNIASGHSDGVITLAKIILELRKLDKTILKTTGKSWHGDAQYWKVDISKAQKIGYEPQTNLREGLAQVLKWYDREAL